MSHATTTLTDQENGWIAECATRLRLIQADAGTLSPEKRREYLQEEMERSLKGAPPANRRRYLQALLQRFPVAGQVVSSAPVPVAAAPPPAPRPLTPEDLLERLLAASADLPDEKREEFGRRLRDAGLVSVDRDSLVVDVSEELRKALGLKPEDQVHLSRVVELAVVLADIFARLDQTAITAMRDLAPKSPMVRRPVDFRTAVALFLVSKDTPLEPHVKAAASLLGGMIAAILGGGRDFGRDLVERLSPSAIEQVVRDEGKGGIFGKKPKELCWEKYAELFEDYATAELVERKLKDCLGTFVEKRASGGR
jgi:PAS domain-containing protein